MVAMGTVDMAAMVSMGMVVMGDMDMDMVTEDMALVVMEGMDVPVPMVGMDTVMATTDMVDLVVIELITAIYMEVVMVIVRMCEVIKCLLKALALQLNIRLKVTPSNQLQTYFLPQR